MNFACPSRIDCPGTDLPFANLSAEAPDQDVFFGFYTGAPWLQPPIGSNWTRNSCLGECSSPDSQADADLCAAINNAQCMFQDWGPPGVYGNGGPSSGPPVVAPPSNPTPVFLNVTTQCTIHCPDGSPFTYQVRAGLFPGINQATADAAAVSYACQLANINAVCLSALSSKACVGTAYSDAITPSRPALYTFVLISGSLPPGLTLASGPSPTGPITGSPTTAGSYTFVVRVTNQVGNWMQKTYTINVMAFVDTTLPDANKGQLYTHVLTATGGTAPYTYTLELGSLPAGITLASDGTLSGTPTVTGDFSVTLGVADAGINFCTKAFTLHVKNPNCPDWTTLVWTPPSIVGTPTYSFLADNFSMHIDGVSGTTQWVADTVGSLSYTGPGCNCRAIVTFNNYTPGVFNGGFKILQDGVQVGAFDPGFNTPGTTVNVDFTLIAGVNSVIEIKGFYNFVGHLFYAFDSFLSPNGTLDYAVHMTNI